MQEHATQKKEGGAIYVFNYDAASRSQLNPQRYFSFSIIKAVCPKNDQCPPEVRAAFYELRVGPIDKTNWESLNSFTMGERCVLKPQISTEEHAFISGKNTSRLYFSPYVVAVWSDVETALSFIHDRLVQNSVEGYIGSVFLDSIHTIEEFHGMSRQIDLSFDVLIKDGGYLHPSGSIQLLKPDLLNDLGFTPIKL